MDFEDQKVTQKVTQKWPPISQRFSSVWHPESDQKSDDFTGVPKCQISRPVYMRIAFKIFPDFLDLKIYFNAKKGPMEEFNT